MKKLWKKLVTRWRAPMKPYLKTISKISHWLVILIGIVEPLLEEIINTLVSVDIELPEWVTLVKKIVIVTALIIRVSTKMTVDYKKMDTEKEIDSDKTPKQM